jgi:hypothetical protein
MLFFLKVGLIFSIKSLNVRVNTRFFFNTYKSICIYNLDFLYSQINLVKVYLDKVLLLASKEKKKKALFISLEPQLDRCIKYSAASCFQGALLSNYYVPGILTNNKHYQLSIKYSGKGFYTLPNFIFLFSFSKGALSQNLVKELSFLKIPVFGFGLSQHVGSKKPNFLLINYLQTFDLAFIYFICFIISKFLTKI